MERQDEEEGEGEGEEEWLLDSLRLYNDLHVFELQDPTRVIEWTGEKSVCVAGYEIGKRNEVLQLVLPQRLYAKENQGLCPERDFKVEHGGFSDRPVYRLKHVPGTSLLVTSGPPDSALQIWRMEPDGTDIIKLLDTIPTLPGGDDGWAKIATTVSKPSRVLHGLRIGNLQVTDIESKQTLFMAGFDGTVHIYDTHKWDPSAQEAKPLFLHKGHVFSGASGAGHPPLVTTHAWHPSKPQTLLSAASDGSLHVWDWADPRGVS